MARRIRGSRQRFRTILERQQSRDQQPADAYGRDGYHGRHFRRGPRTRTSWELIRRFFSLMRPQKSLVVFALATAAASTLLGLLPPAAVKVLFDYVLGDAPLPGSLPGWLSIPADRSGLLLWVVTAVTVVSLVKIAIHMWGRWYATLATKRMQLSVREKVFAHAVRLPLNRVHELKSGGVSSILREDAGSVAELIFGMFYNPWRAVIQLIGSLCVLAWVDWRLLLGALLLVPLVYYTHRTWIGRIRPQHREIRRQREGVDAHATEAFGGMRVVRAFSRQRNETGRFMRGNNLMARLELRAWWLARGIEILWSALLPLSSAALMWYGGNKVLTGELSTGDLMMFLAYLVMLLEPLTVLAESAAQFQNSLSGLDRVLDILDEPREMPPSPNSRRVRKDEVAGGIAFERVTFRYPGSETPALCDISLDVQPGEIIALVGPSGSGKTTLCNLVARFYDPTQGRILLDGRDLRDIEVESYRSLLGVVEQDVFLFDGTVEENIAYSDRNAPDHLVRRGAEIANADEFIRRLPERYDTLIGERGVKLSGGQRQRIAVARAVLADPKILILDEATSNLDTESERLIQAALATLMQNRTCFVIAHRLSTVTHADRIVVLENGGIREIGTHAELMAADGRYREMVQLQLSFSAEPAATEAVNPHHDVD